MGHRYLFQFTLIVALVAASTSAIAQPTPPQPGLTKVSHGNSLTGNGTTTVQLDVRVATGGGLDAGIGGLGVSILRTCASGQTIQWTGSAWACAANASASGVSLGIVALGDSHTNGKLPSAPVTGAETIGAFGLTNTRGEQWNGSGVATTYLANGEINSVSGSTDPNIGLNTTSGTYLSWIPPLLRSSYPALNRIRTANLGVGGSSAFTWAGENASGYVAGLLAPNDGDTVTIAGTTYTFRTSPSVANDVLIGTATGSILNLCNAVNAESTGWGAGTVVNPNAFCPNPAATTYGHFFALSPGTAGNSFTIASSNTLRATAVNGSLVPVSSFAMSGGSATSALYANGKAALVGGAGFGQVDIVLVTLGTNDAARPGDRGRNFQASMTTLISNLKTDFPSAKILLWKPIVNSVTATNTAITSTIIPAVTALVAADPTHVFFVDMNVLGAGAGDTAILSADGVHATYYGYQLLTQLFTAKIASLLSLQAGGTSWAGTAAGTATHLAMFTPDGAHLGDTPLTYDGSTLAVPVSVMQLQNGAHGGAPTVAPSAAASGAGVLTGAYQYCITEYIVSTPLVIAGETPCSPVGSVTLASNSASVTRAFIRPGMDGANLYRTSAGGSDFKLVHAFTNAKLQNVWIDNVADGARGVAAPVVDTTTVYGIDWHDDVKYFRTQPGHAATPADMTIVTGQGGCGGCYSLDSIGGGINARSHDGLPFHGEKYGTTGDAFGLDWFGDTDDGVGGSRVFNINAVGLVKIIPAGALPDSTDRGLTISATMPTVTTATRYAALVDITGSGSSANTQVALGVVLEAGYTGTSATRAGYSLNSTASGGTSYGHYAQASGASVLEVGVLGRASSGTNNFGLFGGLGVDAPLGRTAALGLDNGATGSDLIVATNQSGNAVKLEVSNTGSMGIGSTVSANSFVNLVQASTYPIGIDVTDTATAMTATRWLHRADKTGSFDTTSGALSSIGYYSSVASTRSAGASNLTNFGYYADVSGAQVNYAFYGNAGLLHNTGAVDFSSTGSFGGALTMNSNKVTSLANGTVSSDAAAFGQIASGINAAVSGTANTTTKFTGTNTVGNGWALDDGTTWGVSAKFTITEASGAFVGSSTGSLGGALNMNSHQINNVTNGSLAQDAAAFGQIATAVNAAVSGTSGRVAVFNGTNTITGYAGFLSDTSGNITANQITIANTGNYWWGDQTTKIHGVNGSTVGAGITFYTNSIVRFTIDGTGALTSAGALAMSANKITGLANGTVSTDAAAFGQIASAVNTAVTGTSGTSARFTGTNAIGNGAFTDDGTNATLGGTLTVNGTDVTAKRLTVNATATIASLSSNNTVSSASYDPQGSSFQVSGTANTTSAVRNAYGNFITVNTTRTSTNNALTNYGIITFVSGAQTNYSFYGASGQFLNAQAGEFQASLLVDTTLKVGPGADTVAAAGSAGSWQNNGATSMSVRDASDDTEIALIANNLGVQVGSATNTTLNIITNGTAAIQVDTSQNSTFIGHIIGGSTGVSVAAGGGCGVSPSVAGNDNFGKITVGGSTSTCELTFAHAYTGHEPACHATSTSANSNISISAAGAASVTFSQASPSMSGTTFYYVCGGY